MDTNLMFTRVIRFPSGRHFIMLGLTAENVKRLIIGEPIRITPETHGAHIPKDVAIGIIYGETREVIAHDLKSQGLAGECVELPQSDAGFAAGRLKDDDEGVLNVAMAVDHSSRTLILRFEKPVGWLGLGKQDALSLAADLNRLAAELP